MSRAIDQQGFSAVELLITLFIGVIFLLAGYQLYIFVTTNAAATYRQSKASSQGYQLVRRYSVAAQSPCVSSTDTGSIIYVDADGSGSYNSTTDPQLPRNASLSPAVADLPGARATVTIDCPRSDIQSISRVTSTIIYTGLNGQTEKVYHAIYVSN